MTRLVVYLTLSLLVALGAALLISLPGTVAIDVGSYRLEPSLGTAIFVVLVVIVVAIIVWGIVRRIVLVPEALKRRAEKKRIAAGLEALSGGLIAHQAGDHARARTLARDAQTRLPGNAAAKLLEARAELALGDLGSAREHYRALLGNDKTALAALSGLFEQAVAQDRPTAALTFARKALAIAPTLDWASRAVFDSLAEKGAWADALEMAGRLPARTRAQKAAKKRRQGVLHTALANSVEDTEPEAALEHAKSAMRLIPDFVPAALIAARIHISRGEARKAGSLLRKVWRASGHPDAATLYAHAKPGVSALERLERTRAVLGDRAGEPSAAIVLARAGIDAYEWPTARDALAPFLAEAPTQAMCLLMAEIEEGQSGDQGRAREWLARAVHAPRDPAWTADGTTSAQWAPVSPVTGRLDAFEWKVPVTGHQPALIEDAHADADASSMLELGAPPQDTAHEPAEPMR